MSGLKWKVSRLAIGLLALELSLWAAGSEMNHAKKAQLPVANACLSCTGNGCEDGGNYAACQEFPNSDSPNSGPGCVAWMFGCDKGPAQEQN
jgi:hypothetical protein